jgi:hypothetical protein
LDELSDRVSMRLTPWRHVVKRSSEQLRTIGRIHGEKSAGGPDAGAPPFSGKPFLHESPDSIATTRSAVSIP